MNVTLFGIPNCDQVKKARDWLTGHGISYTFHDFKKNGVSAALIHSWLSQVGRDALLNRRGTTWRQLPPEEQEQVQDDESAIRCMIGAPSVIKRPVLQITGQTRNTVVAGFSAQNYQQTFYPDTAPGDKDRT